MKRICTLVATVGILRALSTSAFAGTEVNKTEPFKLIAVETLGEGLSKDDKGEDRVIDESNINLGKEEGISEIGKGLSRDDICKIEK